MSWRPQTDNPRIVWHLLGVGGNHGTYSLTDWCSYNEQHSGQKCRENRLPETRTGSGLDGDNPPIPADLTLPARPS